MRTSFRNALRGLCFAVRSERNMRVHIAAAFYAFAAAAVTGASRIEWAAVALCVAAVMSAELFNTAVERLCDTVHPDFSRGIGIAKDVAAGGVLLLAAISVLVAAVIFADAEKLTRFLDFVREQTVCAALLALSVPAMVFFVFRRGEK